MKRMRKKSEKNQKNAEKDGMRIFKEKRFGREKVKGSDEQLERVVIDQLHG